MRDDVDIAFRPSLFFLFLKFWAQLGPLRERLGLHVGFNYDVAQFVLESRVLSADHVIVD